MNRPKFYVYLPIVFALLLILGIFIGRTFNINNPDSLISLSNSGGYSKLDEVLRYIEDEYVDTVNRNQLMDNTLIAMLENLDPHSSYISAEELKAANEPLQGNFEGIGIEFNIIDDTIRVLTVIPGGPAETKGLLAGDKIVKVDGEIVANIKISNKGVMDRLKGVGGTQVKVSVKRQGQKNLIDYLITRGTIPLYSIDAAIMISAKTGYIKISRFAATTYDEYINAFKKLKLQGAENIVVDLRGNGGGYLNSAVDIADEFLSKGQGIVYTQGKSRPRADYKATDKGRFESGNLAVLIDEGSASASEILAGALQDNDRATIIGRRSFGKGLVQEQSEFSDGSAMRLTIARYYTPSGRCIQKPYDKGIEAYYMEEYERYENGELVNIDSTKLNDSVKYRTVSGRIVYGGGGIIPDIFVPYDTTGRTKYLTELLIQGIINDFAFDYADRHRKELKKYSNTKAFNNAFDISALLTDFASYANKKGVKSNSEQMEISKKIIATQLKALIARNIWGREAYYTILISDDPVVNKSLEVTEKKIPNL